MNLQSHVFHQPNRNSRGKSKKTFLYHSMESCHFKCFFLFWEEKTAQIKILQGTRGRVFDPRQCGFCIARRRTLNAHLKVLRTIKQILIIDCLTGNGLVKQDVFKIETKTSKALTCVIDFGSYSGFKSLLFYSVVPKCW